ncbi:hypothetical protein J14TS2_44660 [Bacillus sp. J14TS2]|uniref:competence protein ComK n=1 Tax=Bacillus sp. J14TS2 TaxID=2807188 RepID=UPI001AFF3373|nr:competence protein ComK [Bacillus sp. J14TS2]GIN73991.1 hypothetical protein J14TS2_44660 [Bacillus sp. J14TS2]
MSKELIEEYLINPFTLMIRRIVKEGKSITEIIEFEEIYYSAESPLSIVKRNCGYYGCDYEGSKDMVVLNEGIPI